MPAKPDLVFYAQRPPRRLPRLTRLVRNRSNTIIRKAVFAGDRQLRRSSFRFAEDFRALRLRAGLSQADVARAIGVDRSAICRIEAGDEAVSAQIRARASALLGGEFRQSVYSVGTSLIQDQAHARAVETLLACRHPRWKATVEAPVPGPGRRSTDLRLDFGLDVVLIEVETRIGQWEEILRECHDKREAVKGVARTDHRVHVVLALPKTARHRALLRDHPQTIEVAFPIPARELEQALASDGGPWPGDGILWLPGSRQPG